jgi:hypothetical protein
LQPLNTDGISGVSISFTSSISQQQENVLDNHVRFVEVLTALTKKWNIFWDVTPYSSKKFTDVSEAYTASIFRVEK